jgi:tetratricopeptide (TPR) repeat protein
VTGWHTGCRDLSWGAKSDNRRGCCANHSGMRARRVPVLSALIAVVFLLVGLLHARVAHADAKSKKDIEQKMKAAMENYDLLEYEEARKILNQALTIAKKAKMESDPVTAKVHLRLGIVYFAGLQDAESAKLSFLNAVEIDKAIALDKAYSTPEMQKLLEEAKAEAGGGGGGDEPAGGGDEPAGRPATSRWRRLRLGDRRAAHDRRGGQGR